MNVNALAIVAALMVGLAPSATAEILEYQINAKNPIYLTDEESHCSNPNFGRRAWQKRGSGTREGCWEAGQAYMIHIKWINGPDKQYDGYQFKATASREKALNEQYKCGYLDCIPASDPGEPK